jgi:hypothetical protein
VESAPRTPKKVGSRITFLETIAHTRPGKQPTAVESRWTRSVDSSEQVYTRQITVGKDWTKLDPGWITSCALLHIKNEEGRFVVNPTEFELELLKKKIVEVEFSQPNAMSSGILVRPGKTSTFEPNDLKTIFLRADIPTEITVTLFPGDD